MILYYCITTQTTFCNIIKPYQRSWWTIILSSPCLQRCPLFIYSVKPSPSSFNNSQIRRKLEFLSSVYLHHQNQLIKIAPFIYKFHLQLFNYAGDFPACLIKINEATLRQVQKVSIFLRSFLFFMQLQHHRPSGHNSFKQFQTICTDLSPYLALHHIPATQTGSNELAINFLKRQNASKS